MTRIVPAPLSPSPDIKRFAFETVQPAGSAAPVKITGTEGNDTLEGTAADELIEGLGGNDDIGSDYGSDTMLGGAGNDTL
ncbi:MAG TPA: hypothetical protein VF800_26915, partial [Telluria sp.]